jgi:hypothetical protein
MSRRPTLMQAPRPSRALAALQDWSAMAEGAFAVITLRAWRADWESRGVTVGDLRDVVNPSLGRTHAFDGCPGTDTQGLRGAGSEAQCCGQNFLRFRPRRFGSCLAAVQPGHPCPVVRRRAACPASRRKPVVCHPWQTPLVACDEPCFSRRGDHPPSLRSTRNEHSGHKAATIGAIRHSTIASAGPL